jgi:hypothetical protein
LSALRRLGWIASLMGVNEALEEGWTGLRGADEVAWLKVRPFGLHGTGDGGLGLVGELDFYSGGVELTWPISRASWTMTPFCNLALLRDGLGADAAQVRYIEAADWYVRPAAVIAEYDAVVQGLTDGGAPHVRAVAELSFGSTAGEHATWTRYEAIVNRAFKRLPMWVVCLYDTRALPEQLVEAVRRTHPTVWDDGRRRQSASYVDPAVLLRQIPEPSPPGGPRSSCSPSARSPPTPCGTVTAALSWPCGTRTTGSSARSMTTDPALTTRSPVTSHPAATRRPGAWACGSPGSSATRSPSGPDRTGRRCGSGSARGA